MSLPKGNQIAAARALLGWDQKDVAEKVHLSVAAISKIEKGENKGKIETLERIEKAFSDAGVEFTNYDGVRKKPSGIITHMGREGFAEFIWDVYETTKAQGGEICVSNIDEALFTYWLGTEVDNAYMAKMQELKNFTFKILIKEGDYNFTASPYAEYRWVPKEQFLSVPFYVYGDKLAFLLFREDVTIHVMDNADIAAAQRMQFNIAWDNAIIPAEG
jgi:transcriptional regulator with XRE-family HTH domain